MSDSSEHRRARRIAAKQGVWCESPKLTLYTQTINLSLTGAFVRTPHPPAPGEQVQLRFADIGVTFQTEVVWVRTSQRPSTSSDHPGMGLRYLNPQGDAAYEALIEKLTKDSERDPTTGRHKLPK